MSDLHIPYSQYIDRAHQDRADALARAGYLLITAVAGAAASIREILRRWRERRQATRSLLALDDRLLKDAGLTRGDIWAAVHGQFPDREDDAAPTPADDIALDVYAIGGCNDNQQRRRAA
jgi:uncharacterized protein YjiS (DUF1127 family)